MSNITPLYTARVFIEDAVLREMVACAEAGYPEEVAGLLLGCSRESRVHVSCFLSVENSLRAEERVFSYQISSADWQRGEQHARQLALELVGVFHSHPDHPSQPSRSDLEFALPNFIYIIAAIYRRTLTSVQAWRLCEDRSQFENCLWSARDEPLLIPQEEKPVA
jgi:proteasome lid subunit RPN8/RPN11